MFVMAEQRRDCQRRRPRREELLSKGPDGHVLVRGRVQTRSAEGAVSAAGVPFFLLQGNESYP